VALFHRRVIQQRLNDICHLLTWEQGEHLVARLNAPGYRAVSAEWEIVLLFAVSRLTSVQYEPALGGGRSADLVMQIPGESSVFADIVAVSDAGIRRLNPLDEFQDEIARLLARKGIPNRGFEYRIESRQTSVGPKKIVSALALPAPADYRTAFGDEFLSFLDRIGEDPSSEHTYVFPSPYQVALSYLPGRKHNTGAHPGYDAYEAYEAPILSAIKKKYRQLRSISRNDPIGIFVCDAGAELFRITWSTQFSKEKLAEKAFGEFPNLSFLALITAEKRPRTLNHGRCSVFYNHASSFRCPGVITPVFSELADAIPDPAINPHNLKRVLQRLRNKEGVSFFGQVPARSRRIAGREEMQIKLSARTLLDLLTQKIDFGLFMKAHGFDRQDPAYGGGNPFHDLSGLTIASAHLERCPDEDDDWFVLDLVGEDPAVGPIRNPVPAAADAGPPPDQSQRAMQADERAEMPRPPRSEEV
jgi:hypothetical protein